MVEQIEALEAEIHLFQLLDRVETGETIAIVRDGKIIARIVPNEGDRERQVKVTE